MAPTEKPVRTFPHRRGAINAASRTWILHIRGGHTCLSSHENEYDERPGGERGVIRGFSKASRKRMLEMIDEIDWLTMGPGLFVTMTLPDGTWDRVKDRVTQVRSQWIRDSENFLQVKFPTMWRIEWKVRQSGNEMGEMRPHWHLLIPGVRWYDRKDATAIWKKIIGHTGSVSFKVKRMDTRKKIAVYIAKYCAKETDPSSLDYVAKLNNYGRHWGVTRKGLMAMHPKRTYEDIPREVVEAIRKLREEWREGYSSQYDAGFSTYGPWSVELNAAIEKIVVDAGCKPV